MKTQITAPKTLKARPRKSIAGATNGQRPIAITKILVPTDFSPASEKAFQYASRLAEEFDAQVTLLHVLELDTSSVFAGLAGASALAEEEVSSVETKLRALIDAASKTGAISAKSTIRTGFATHEIVEAAKELDVDLIIIATHGFTGWKYFAIGSTAERVVRAAPCPVLVVREKEHDFI
jgi:universal stress protein A